MAACQASVGLSTGVSGVSGDQVEFPRDRKEAFMISFLMSLSVAGAASQSGLTPKDFKTLAHLSASSAKRISEIGRQPREHYSAQGLVTLRTNAQQMGV